MPRDPDERVRQNLAAELGPSMEAIEHAAVFEAAQGWPHGDRLPVRRGLPGGVGVDHGYFERGRGPVVFVISGPVLTYETFEDAAREGWRVDGA